VHADLVVDDELEPRQADPGVRQLRELEGELWVADVHRDLHRDLRHLAALAARYLERNQPLVDVAGVAFGARDGHGLAVLQALGGVARTDDRRDAELARNDGSVAGASAAVVMMAAASFITGSQL